MRRINNTDKNTGSNEISALYKKMLPPMLALNSVLILICLIGGFGWRKLTGLIIGFIYMMWCLWYLGRTVVRAVDMTVKKAKHTMAYCYAVRYAGLFALCFAAFELDLFSAAGILLPQFYPRAVLSLDALTGKNYFGKD
ncbi:ATP synthase subunit I [Ruminococcus sp. Marseille-P6503]|uniref:ATP synthase subunit I n=1 Tax=Ruminococcus sp. Marseille-P6503 TaxID=2364796 RepID=UPI000F548F2B|nr:ATP synthase subunit I [Ruminococcus sp. Marseille-P6503]